MVFLSFSVSLTRRQVHDSLSSHRCTASGKRQRKCEQQWIRLSVTGNEEQTGRVKLCLRHVGSRHHGSTS